MPLDRLPGRIAAIPSWNFVQPPARYVRPTGDMVANAMKQLEGLSEYLSPLERKKRQLQDATIDYQLKMLKDAQTGNHAGMVRGANGMWRYMTPSEELAQKRFGLQMAQLGTGTDWASAYHNTRKYVPTTTVVPATPLTATPAQQRGTGPAAFRVDPFLALVPSSESVITPAQNGTVAPPSSPAVAPPIKEAIRDNLKNSQTYQNAVKQFIQKGKTPDEASELARDLVEKANSISLNDVKLPIWDNDTAPEEYA